MVPIRCQGSFCGRFFFLCKNALWICGLKESGKSESWLFVKKLGGEIS